MDAPQGFVLAMLVSGPADGARMPIADTVEPPARLGGLWCTGCGCVHLFSGGGLYELAEQRWEQVGEMQILRAATYRWAIATGHDAPALAELEAHWATADAQERGR